MVYQVIKMYGDFEPWWFLEDWKNDITNIKEFQSYEEALAYYEEEWQALDDQFPKVNSKSNLMSAFWRTDDLRWCEDCDEDLQQYHSLMMLRNWKELPKDLQILDFDHRNAEGIHPSCSIKQHKTVS